MTGRGVLAALTLALCAAAPAAARAQPADSAWLAARGFYMRGEADRALVHLDTDGLRDVRGARVTQVIGGSLDRLEIRTGAGRRTVIVLHEDEDWRRTGDRGCELALYLNGRRVQQVGTRSGSIDNIMRRTDLDGLEIYEGEHAPAGDAAECGAALIWSFRMRGTVDDEFTGQLRGRVLRQPGGEPVAGVRMTLEPDGESQQTDSSGRFDFGGVPAAVYDLTAVTPSGASWSTRIALRAYAIADIVIEVEGGGAGFSPGSPPDAPPGPTPEREPERSAGR